MIARKSGAIVKVLTFPLLHLQSHQLSQRVAHSLWNATLFEVLRSFLRSRSFIRSRTHFIAAMTYVRVTIVSKDEYMGAWWRRCYLTAGSETHYLIYFYRYICRLSLKVYLLLKWWFIDFFLWEILWSFSFLCSSPADVCSFALYRAKSPSSLDSNYKAGSRSGFWRIKVRVYSLYFFHNFLCNK